MFLMYCDESCHLPNDDSNVMVLGTTYCKKEIKKEIFSDIKKLKIKHGLSPYFEIKWTKVSRGKQDFYEDLIHYFFSNPNLYFRCIVVRNKKELDHTLFNNGSHNEWYYKMYFFMLRKLIISKEHYRIYVDIKDTIGGKKILQLKEYLNNSKHDWDQKTIENIQLIRSHESEILQITDLLIGALGYYYRGLNEINTNSAKTSLVNLINEYYLFSLEKSSPYSEKKFNIFLWKSQQKKEMEKKPFIEIDEEKIKRRVLDELFTF